MPEPVTPAAAPAPAPAPAATPAAAAPAAAPAATPAVAAKAPEAVAPVTNILGDKPAAEAAAAAGAPTAAEQRAYLVEKTEDGKTDAGKALIAGKTDEEIAKLFDALKKTEAAPGEVKPEDFVVKAPEGVEVDPKLMGEFQAALADAKLTPAERAQKLFDLHEAQMTAQAEASTNLWMKTQTDWQAAWKSDAELGGANFDTVTSTIAKALDAIGGAEAAKIREAFVFTGAGNNPEIGRMFYRMAKALTEGGAIAGDTPAKLGEMNGDAALSALYPTATKVR